MAGNVLVTGPQTRAISLNDFKVYARIDQKKEDSFILIAIAAAQKIIESITNRKLISQTWRLDLNYFEHEIILPFSPVTAINSITYFDTDNAQQTFPVAEYDSDLSSLKAIIRPAYGYCWPTLYPKQNAASITYTVGYPSSQTLDGDLKIAMFALVLQMYEERKTDVDLKFVNKILGDKTIKSFV